MRFVRSHQFKRSYKNALAGIQKRTNKTLRLLSENPFHPSLGAEVVDSGRRVWQARINGGWRVYYRIEENTSYLLDIIRHPK